MQDNVEQCTNALIEAIRHSREYSKFQSASAALDSYPELRSQIDQYRKDVYRLQNYSAAGELYDRTEQFHQERALFRKNPLVNDYLSSELAVCRMLQRAASRVVDAVDLELDDVAPDIR